MNTTTLQQALADLKYQRSTLDRAIIGIEEALSTLGSEMSVTQTVSPRGTMKRGGKYKNTSSYIEDAIKVYETVGKPLHIKMLIDQMSRLRGKAVSRASVESSVIRHIAKAKEPKLARFGASTYGLNAWKNPPKLAQTA
jgi:hypothetical protein